jgi:hypothetical protein
MTEFDNNFLDFFDKLEINEEIEETIAEKEKYEIKFIYQTNKRIAFIDIPEGLLKVLAKGTKLYEYHSTIELPENIIRKYELKRV